MNERNKCTATRPIRFGVALLLLLGMGWPVFSQVPARIDFQGRLEDATPPQDPVTATLPMEFRIYGSPMGSDLLWSESWAGVDVVGGIFSVLLGSDNNPIVPNLFTTGAERFLEIVIDGETLMPRQRIAAVGYAMSADQAGRAGDLACDGCVNPTELDSAYAASTVAGGPAVDLACADCVSSGEVQFSFAASDTKSGSALDLDCADCVGSGEVQFGFAGSGTKGGPAADVSCVDCITSAEIENTTIVNADINGNAAIAPSKISGTAWTSTNDGAGTGLDADLWDGSQPRDLLKPSHHAIAITVPCAGGSLAFGNKYQWIFVDHGLKTGNEICQRYGLQCTEVIRCQETNCATFSTGLACTTTPDPGRFWPIGLGSQNGDAYACCQ